MVVVWNWRMGMLFDTTGAFMPVVLDEPRLSDLRSFVGGHIYPGHGVCRKATLNCPVTGGNLWISERERSFGVYFLANLTHLGRKIELLILKVKKRYRQYPVRRYHEVTVSF